MSVWQGENCPRRGPGLSHVHAKYALGAPHCIHCGAVLSTEPPAGVPASASEAALPARTSYAKVFDHLFVFTRVGGCAVAGCSFSKEEHAEYRIGGKENECTVDHRSIEPWTECPICHDIVEPQMSVSITKTEQTPMLLFTKRILDRLDQVHEGWMAGFYKS